MAYENPWSNDDPPGSIDARELDDAIRRLRSDIAERMTDVLGVPWADDPLLPADVLTVTELLDKTKSKLVRRRVSWFGGTEHEVSGTVAREDANIGVTGANGVLHMRFPIIVPAGATLYNGGVSIEFSAAGHSSEGYLKIREYDGIERHSTAFNTPGSFFNQQQYVGFGGINQLIEPDDVVFMTLRLMNHGVNTHLPLRMFNYHWEYQVPDPSVI